MKKTKCLIITFFIFFCYSISISQDSDPNGFKCEIPSGAPGVNQSLIGGQHKPERTDYNGVSSDAVFRVLIVFVQFADDPGPEVGYWPVNQAPTYLNDILAETKSTNFGSKWWNAYSESTAPLSDYWMEVSRGHFHIVGTAVNVILPRGFEYYQGFGSEGIEMINDHIYGQIQNSVNWPDYDLWSKSGNDFIYEPDGIVDMIYKVHRSHSPLMGMPAGGIAFLYDSYSQGTNYLIYDDANGNEIYINGGFGDEGSGLTMTPGHGYGETDPLYFRYAPMNVNGVVSFSEHEHGHYIFGGGHQKYGKMMGYTAEYGFDEFLSPYESIRLGYMSSIPAVFTTTNTLSDYSSRDNNSQGQVIEVPISGSSEFFLIANRQKVSNYDRIMWGDTCHGDPYRLLQNGDSPDYGNGVYIYHAAPGSSGYPWLINFDNECADGLWNWQQSGTQHPDWSSTQDVEYYIRTTPDFTHNDNGGDGGLSYHDGKSLYTWFGIGKREYPLYEGGDGTDKVYTNDQQAWTSREWQGDRWDPWKVGYNEVFSPYSSPSTAKWNNDASGIYIYLESQSGITANFKIYKVGEDGLSDDDILELTPPSKPMLYRPIELVNCYAGWANPRIIWDNNLEPDMVRTSGRSFKRYKIYRAYNAGNGVPVTYQYLDTYDDYTPNDTANYIDNNIFNGVRVYCGMPGPINYNDVNYRYKITAVDQDDNESVPSDFLFLAGHPILPDRPSHENNELPSSFKLSQNYPNPFNPSTEIKFDLPQNVNVTLRVYNTIGQLTAELVSNEFRSAGRYSVSFNGSNLASGIYFYTLEAGTFRDVKKMVLIK